MLFYTKSEFISQEKERSRECDSAEKKVHKMEIIHQLSEHSARGSLRSGPTVSSFSRAELMRGDFLLCLRIGIVVVLFFGTKKSSNKFPVNFFCLKVYARIRRAAFFCEISGLCCKYNGQICGTEQSPSRSRCVECRLFLSEFLEDG